ncbi:MAG: hypothetical protein NTW07_11560 [candidate division Zixibacteria bacterium]|nr:hypothetical protein [candidate division Zixibacteria bacterium]
MSILSGMMIVLLVLLIGSSLDAAQGKGKNQTPKTPPTPESEYAARFKTVETALATFDKPYLVLDTKRSRLSLRLRGVTVRDYRYTLMSDSEDVATFKSLAISGDTLPKSLVRLHVFDAEPQLNDTVLGIVSKATIAAPELLQRYRPGRVTATFANRVVLDVHALDITGVSSSWKANLAEDLRLFADNFLGGETLRIAITRDDAMSFYGTCQGAPALLIAP